MAGVVHHGDVVIATHPSFFFYLAYDLHRLDKGRPLDLGDVLPDYEVGQSNVYNTVGWIEKGKPVSSGVFLIKDVASSEAGDAAEIYLTDNCTRESLQQLLPDSGFDLKERFLPSFPRVRYRIELQHYNCQKLAAR